MTDVDNWVSREFQILAQTIYEYDQNLEFEMVPFSEHHKLIDKSKVFRIIDNRNGKIVLYADSLSNPQQILARLFSMDQAKGDVVARLDAENAAAEALRLQAIIEQREEQKEFFLFLGKNTKSRWHHKGRVRDDEYRDLGPVAKVIT